MSSKLVILCVLLNAHFGISKNCKIFLQKWEFVKSNNNFVHSSVLVEPINETLNAVSLNSTLHQDFPLTTTVTLDTYAEFANEYRKVPVTFTRNFCDFLKNEYKWFAFDLKDAKFPTKCPIKKDFYYVKKFAFVTDKFPVVCNWESIKLNINIFDAETTETITIVDLYFKSVKK